MIHSGPAGPFGAIYYQLNAVHINSAPLAILRNE
jgi:hypothetical protein